MSKRPKERELTQQEMDEISNEYAKQFGAEDDAIRNSPPANEAEIDAVFGPDPRRPPTITPTHDLPRGPRTH